MFSTSAKENLKCYVYYLKDPRNKKVFYVGKGTGDRVFQHLDCALKTPQENDKLSRIKEIVKSGKKVEHYILRHGLTAKEALEVESALIDFLGLNNITNIVSGHNTFSYGLKSVEEIEIQYAAKEIRIVDPVIIININKKYDPKINMTQDDIYEVTRSAWVVGKRRENAIYALSSYKGIIRGVFKIERWIKVKDRRYAFEGYSADEAIQKKYLHKAITKYIVKGKANPINYVLC